MLLFIMVVVACGQPSPQVTPTVTSPLRVTLYQSPTPTLTQTEVTKLETMTPTPLPTATPFTHTIVKGETMSGIALKYRVSLEDLKEANPEVDPNYLVVGKSLIIPLTGVNPITIPSLTPIPFPWEQPYCYSVTSGGYVCYLVVTNNRQRVLENLSGWIGLYFPDGKNIAGQPAVAPLNILPPGHSMPLVAFFPESLGAKVTPRGEILTAVRVPPGDSRYLEAELADENINIDNEGKFADVRGEVSLLGDKSTPGLIWVVAVAYGEGGRVVGTRKWEADSQCLGIPLTGTPGTDNSLLPTQAIGNECLKFTMTVYSLGPKIAKVDLLIEARP